MAQRDSKKENESGNKGMMKIDGKKLLHITDVWDIIDPEHMFFSLGHMGSAWKPVVVV